MTRKKIVWVNGCFDIIHPGHFELLRYAATLGQLHVGIDSDLRVSKSKGPSRPIFDEGFRADMLTCFSFIKKVYIFETDWDLRLTMKKLKPDFMVIGDEYKDRTIIGAESVKRIVFFPKSLHSTTEIINKIKNG
jgi:D-beta-D-heptose 7-phosphate kinase/D-beta-D-heptose 1-phosphate adenosyltransferase